MKYLRYTKHKKLDPNKINWNTVEAERLVGAFMVAVRRPDLLRLFLDDLCSKRELEALMLRIHIVEMILMGMPYRYITDATGLSSATISKISKPLINKRGGYQEIMYALHPHGYQYKY